MEDGTPIGDGWQIGDGAFFGEGFTPKQGTCSVLAVSNMDGQTLAYLGTLNADNHYDSGDLENHLIVSRYRKQNTVIRRQ